MPERILTVNGVELCVETFGDPADPAILLIGGLAASMDWWEDAFCLRLAEGSRYVVRYDHRDTGRSTTCPAGAPDYTAADLVRDAAALLDALSVGPAQIVGVSMGGALGQLLALRHPERVASLTLIATAPAVRRPGAPELPPIGRDLPPPPPDPDWSDPAAVVEHLVEEQRGYAPRSFDEARARAVAERVVARTPDLRPGRTNHLMLADGAPDDERLCDLAVPTLVVHGTADPLFPLAYGEALASEIPGAALLVLEDVGHEAPPPQTWDAVVPAILGLTDPGGPSAPSGG